MEKIVKVYDRENYLQLLNGVQVVEINKINEVQKENITEVCELSDLKISTVLFCSFCKTHFNDSVEQRQHYKSDWHRYNLKLNLKSQEPISEEDFDQLADDVSSISGSDSDSDDISKQENTTFDCLGKIYFQNSNGKIFSFFRSLVHEKKDIPENNDVLLQLVKQNCKNLYWTILMIGGGHFAGAVFNGSEILVHKTFHCYTVRAKAGGSQSSRDNKVGGANSAGASLRRYNEQSLVQHIGDLLESWIPHLEKSNTIFYRAAGPYNRMVLFGGKNPILKKNDTRLRNIPFSTRRATFTEIKRVHDLLSNVEVYSCMDSFKTNFITQKPLEECDASHSSRKDSPKNKNINRAKSREIKERDLPVTNEQLRHTSESEYSEEFNLNSSNLEINLDSLKEFGNSLQDAKKQQKPEKKKKLSKKEKIKKWEDNLKKDLINACSKGDLDILKNILLSIKDDVTESSIENGIIKVNNLSLDEYGNKILHIAAVNNKSDIIHWLLENNVNPCCKNDKLQTPYTINSDKIIRNVFRKFAADNPEKYDYPKANIPINLSTKTEDEIAEKRRAQRKVKREREKEKKKENEIKRKEEEDRNRFLNLTDREKRALAAERRILAQNSVVLARCFLCGEDISGKIPFEYSGNRFCSVHCLKAHRIQNPVVLS